MRWGDAARPAGAVPLPSRRRRPRPEGTGPRGRRIAPMAVAALILVAAARVPAAARLVDGVVAVVNDEPITFSEFRDHVAEGLGIPAGDADLLLREEGDAGKVLRSLEELIETVLVRQELKKEGHEVAETEIDRAVESVRKANNLTEAAFTAALERDGIALEAYRRRIRWQMERGAIIRTRKVKDVSVTDDELKEFFRENAERFLRGAEVRIETLLLPLPSGAAERESAIRLRIAGQQAHDYVRAGMTLSEAAKALSAVAPGAEVLSSGFLPADDLLPEIRKEAERLRTGETSPPFFTESGVHLVTLLERRGGSLPDFAAVRESLSAELVDRRSEKAYADVLTELKKAATIDIRL